MSAEILQVSSSQPQNLPQIGETDTLNDQTLSEKGLQQVVDAESLNRWAQGGLDARKVAASDDQLLRQKQVEGTVDGVGYGVTAVGRCVDLARCVGRDGCVGWSGSVDRNRCVGRGR